MKELREQDIDLIERVLSESASEEDLTTFNQRLADEPAFAARVEILKNINANVGAESDQFEALLESIHQEYQQNDMNKAPEAPAGFRRVYYIAASLALLLAAIFVFRNLSGPSSMERLYADNFTKPPENITTRDNSGYDDHLIAAVDAYRQNDFKNAITNFNTYLESHPEDDAANFYMGISYLADNQHDPSIKFLQKVINNQDSIYRSAAQWYLGLAHIKSGNTEAAKTIFATLASSNSSYAVKSKVILEKLRKE